MNVIRKFKLCFVIFEVYVVYLEGNLGVMYLGEKELKVGFLQDYKLVLNDDDED